MARALDLIGERWTLLIVRELFARECRYSDLRESLPGIATNLLASRLRQLEAEGVVESYDAPPPVRATVYRLTARGRDLRHVLRALVAWGSPLLLEGQGDDHFRSHWLSLALPIIYDGVVVDDLAPLTVVVRTGDGSSTLTITGSGLAMTMGEPKLGGAVIVEGESANVTDMLLGTGDRDITEKSWQEGLSIQGAAEAVERLRLLVSRSPVAGRENSRPIPGGDVGEPASTL